MKKTVLALTLAASAVVAASNAAEARVYPTRVAGALTCNMNPALGLGIGSYRAVGCTFAYRTRRGRLVQHVYYGSMNRIGLDVGLVGDQVVTWTVATPGGQSRRGMFTGATPGYTHDLTVLQGPGTNGYFNQPALPAGLTYSTGTGLYGLGGGFGPTTLVLKAQ